MSKKLVLLNFVPVAAGGGVQNALSFLAALAKEKDFLGFDVTVVCVSGGEVDKFCSEKKISVLSINKGKLSRFTFEMFGGYFLVKRLKVSLIFTPSMCATCIMWPKSSAGISYILAQGCLGITSVWPMFTGVMSNMAIKLSSS